MTNPPSVPSLDVEACAGLLAELANNPDFYHLHPRAVASLDNLRHFLLEALPGMGKDSATVAALTAENERLKREVKAWRWLHWGQLGAFWACQCGEARGPGLTEPCPDCGTPRPAKGVPTDYGFGALPSSREGGIVYGPFDGVHIEPERPATSAAALPSSRETTDG